MASSVSSLGSDDPASDSRPGERRPTEAFSIVPSPAANVERVVQKLLAGSQLAPGESRIDRPLASLRDQVWSRLFVSGGRLLKPRTDQLLKARFERAHVVALLFENVT